MIQSPLLTSTESENREVHEPLTMRHINHSFGESSRKELSRTTIFILHGALFTGRLVKADVRTRSHSKIIAIYKLLIYEKVWQESVHLQQGNTCPSFLFSSSLLARKSLSNFSHPPWVIATHHDLLNGGTVPSSSALCGECLISFHRS